MGGRAGNSSGTWEAISQKQFGLAESFCGFEILTGLNSKTFGEILLFLQPTVPMTS